MDLFLTGSLLLAPLNPSSRQALLLAWSLPHIYQQASSPRHVYLLFLARLALLCQSILLFWPGQLFSSYSASARSFPMGQLSKVHLSDLLGQAISLQPRYSPVLGRLALVSSLICTPWLGAIQGAAIHCLWPGYN